MGQVQGEDGHLPHSLMQVYWPETKKPRTMPGLQDCGGAGSKIEHQVAAGLAGM
jgi:hypothetical protein